MPPKKLPSKATTASGKPPAAAKKPPGTNVSASKAATKSGSAAAKPVVTGRSGTAGQQRGRGAAISVRGKGRGGIATGKQPVQAKGKAGNEARDPVKSQKPVWTKEDGAARKIQSVYRRHRAKKALAARRKEKEEYDALMDKIQRDAWVQVIKMEREEQERQRQKEEDERRRKRESEKRIKRLLEAAFDGDNDEILTMFDEVFQDAKEWLVQKGSPLPTAMALASRQQEKLVHSTDANGNTPLSEAASGGHSDSIQLLIEKGADPNTKGQFDRTPLYRAAFAGHLEAVQILLRHGADPRLYASDGTTPQQIASVPGIEAVLQEWDCGQTDILLEKMQSERERHIREDKEHQEKEANRLEDKRKQALKENESKQKQLAKAYEELNKRIYEHDKCMAEGTMKPDVTLEAIHEAEATLEETKLQAEEAQRKLDEVRLSIREQQNQAQYGDDTEPDEVGVKVTIRELDEVLMRDVGDRIRKDGRCPLLIDMSAQTATFLRYRDTNYLNSCSPKDMEPETIRMAVLGAMRYGKFVVLDMNDVDMLDACTQRFDAVQPGLLQSIISKDIVKNEKYLSLVQTGDGEQYSKNSFNQTRVDNFNMVFITRMRRPPEELLRQTYPIRIHIPS